MLTQISIKVMTCWLVMLCFKDVLSDDICGSFLRIQHTNNILKYQICNTNKKHNEVSINIVKSIGTDHVQFNLKESQPQMVIGIVGHFEETFKVDEISSFTKYKQLVFSSHTIYKLAKLFKKTKRCIMDNSAPRCQELAKVLATDGELLNIHLEDKDSKYLIDVDKMNAENEEKTSRKRFRRSDTSWCPTDFICHGRTNVTKITKSSSLKSQLPTKSFNVQLTVKRVVTGVDSNKRKRRNINQDVDNSKYSPRRIVINYFNQIEHDSKGQGEKVRKTKNQDKPTTGNKADISEVLEHLQDGLTFLRFINKLEHIN